MIDDPYLETKVMTATPFQLHMMVIDGAIRHTTRAREALEEKNFETSHFSLNSAREFVGELIGGLNAEHAPELVENLKGLFGFAYKRLVDADVKHEAALIDDALRVLKMHRESWEALGEKLKAEQSADDTQPQQRSWTT